MSRSARDGYGTSRQLTPIPLSRADADPRNVLHEDDPSILVAGSSLISRSSSLWKGQPNQASDVSDPKRPGAPVLSSFVFLDRTGLLGSAYRRASAASAGLRESRERLQDSSFRLRTHFRTRRDCKAYGPWPGRKHRHRHTQLLIYGLFQKGRVLAQDVTRNAPLILPVARPGSPHETSSGLVPRSRLGGNLARLCIRAGTVKESALMAASGPTGS